MMKTAILTLKRMFAVLNFDIENKMCGINCTCNSNIHLNLNNKVSVDNLNCFV
jgi:hypothetical protein